MGLKQVLVGGTTITVLVAGLAGLSTVRDTNASICPGKTSHTSPAGSDDAPHGRGPGGGMGMGHHVMGMGHGGMGTGNRGMGTGHGGMGHGGAGKGVEVGPSCNQVEMMQPHNSTYVPNIARASAADRSMARKLLAGVNDFCRTNSVAAVVSTWRPGLSNSAGPTHFFNPDRSRGLDPANPRAALVYDGRLGGVMFTGSPLPPLGSIPRAHTHEVGSTVEMVHVYCTDSLKEAFTPNRLLGVKADLVSLRLELRPAVMDLSGAELHAVLAEVRELAGDELSPFAPVPSLATGGPDPVLQAMRTEIRRSLMVLTEAQLRRLQSLMSQR